MKSKGFKRLLTMGEVIEYNWRYCLAWRARYKDYIDWISKNDVEWERNHNNVATC